ncbi:phosphoribosylamine--glycine ligase [Sabulicella rubraurantiaca]|uniref:phosphoribosylamine--glycine ligase n=1 Tax=Sabulicella rubraurantiaca TaxID=2811429 RepID=UPI001A975675|nr:phosphoribosylamine--glycine ligase [Sabulicella rubraurantiaca]
MKIVLALPALLVLAACARTPSGPPLTPEQQACREEARRSPEYREVMRRVNPMFEIRNDGVISDDLRVAEAQAWRRCLRERGLAVPGGVEIIRGR